jgi:thymidylate synthase (FAD)
MKTEKIDPLFRVALIRRTEEPQRCVYAAMHQDYCEDFIADQELPEERKAGAIAVKRLLGGDRGHFGCTEHPQITLNVGWFPHSVMQQARTHRIGCCLAGDTVVDFGHPSINEGQVFYRKTIKELADLWHRGRSHQKTQNDAMYMREQIKNRKLLQANESTGMIQHTSITNIYENGAREVYLITLSDGLSIRATLDHKVFTPGGWARFGDLSVGDFVMTAKSVGREIVPTPPDLSAEISTEEWRVVPGFDWYEVSSLGRLRSWAPRKHRGKLVAPAKPKLKKQTAGASGHYFYASMSDGSGRSIRANIHTLVLNAFVGPAPTGSVARHLNGNQFDNRLRNLAWGSEHENAEDRKLHGVSRAKKVTPVEIASILYVGVEQTYDIEVSGPCHNFIANGIVVHNSFDVQSGRYTGQRILDAASGKRTVEEVFYLRPPQRYRDRDGADYEYTEEDRRIDLARCYDAACHYAHQIRQGKAEEQARELIPYGMRQHFVVSFTMRSLMHFLDLRAKLDAQQEIRWLCDLMWPHFVDWAPEIAQWYEEKRLHKAKLAP